MSVSLCTVLLSWSPPRQVPAKLPQRLPDGMGVNAFIRAPYDKMLDSIAATGFKIVRTDVVWATTERSRGVYHWSHYDSLTSALEARGLRPYYILDFSNALYAPTVKAPGWNGVEVEKPTAPRTPAAITAYARWAAAAARHFRGRGIIWELGNEPNEKGSWLPAPNAKQYAALAMAAARAIHAADSSAVVVAPAVSGFPWEYLRTLFASGVLRYLDGVSVHAYRAARRPPKSACADFQRLRDLVRQYDPGPSGRRIAVISGEWGYATSVGDLSPDEQASYAVRMQLSNLMCGVPISIWYEWKDAGPDKTQRKMNYGLLTTTNHRKPALSALRVMATQLAGFSPERWLPASTPQDDLLLLKSSAGATRLAVWTSGSSHDVDVAIPGLTAGTVTGYASDGRKQRLAVVRGHVRMRLTTDPQYVEVTPGS